MAVLLGPGILTHLLVSIDRSVVLEPEEVSQWMEMGGRRKSGRSITNLEYVISS